MASYHTGAALASHLLGYVFVSLSIEPGPSHYHVFTDGHCNRKFCVLTPRCTYVAHLISSAEPGSLYPGVMLAMTESSSNRSCLFDRVSLMVLTEMEPEGRSSASRSKYTSLACAYTRGQRDKEMTGAGSSLAIPSSHQRASVHTNSRGRRKRDAAANKYFETSLLMFGGSWGAEAVTRVAAHVRYAGKHPCCNIDAMHCQKCLFSILEY